MTTNKELITGFAEKLEIHYYLADEGHSMDAFVRNRCEAELLAVFQEICATLGLTVPVETLAQQEGGLREFWKFLNDNSVQINVVLLIFGTILTTANTVLTRFPVSNPDGREEQIQDLTIEEKRLTIAEKKLAIEKLKQELKNGAPKEETLNSAARATEQNLKIQTRRSNYYKLLTNYKKVTAVGFSPLDQKNNRVAKERFVPRADFERFVLATNDLPVEKIDSASIEIIAPVLREGNYRWKGIYEGEPISFAMTDTDFKDSVLREEVSFQHGSRIECVLHIFRKFDELGVVVTTGYSVVTVLQKTDGGISVETPQGKRHRAYKKFVDSQQGLF